MREFPVTVKQKGGVGNDDPPPPTIEGNGFAHSGTADKCREQANSAFADIFDQRANDPAVAYDEILVVVMAETTEAVANIDDILSIPARRKAECQPPIPRRRQSRKRR